MAYLARSEPADSRPLTSAAIETVGGARDFTSLEWSIIRLTRGDGLWTIREPSLLRRLYNWLVGSGMPRLANDRLEALRRMAVLSRYYGFSVSGEDVADFLSAGFTVDQYDLLVSSERAALRSQFEAREAHA